FVVLDSNLPASSQVPWLEQQLGNSSATWKFVMFHHPLYSSEPGEDHKAVRETWGPIFDQYHVDVVFEGHEHAYMRTFPLKGGQKVGTPAEGTIYLISSSGTKLYEQVPAPYMEVNFTKTPMYNLIDILPATDKAGDKLTFRGYDLEGNVKDQFSIEKNTPE
ncbi:MAG: metallophosphoesterase, partial [Armatimonadota bacterium]